MFEEQNGWHVVWGRSSADGSEETDNIQVIQALLDHEKKFGSYFKGNRKPLMAF